MSSCTGCKKRTSSFCFVHKAGVCDDCTPLVGTPQQPKGIQCNAICCIGNYFDWLADSDYNRHIQCPCCHRALTTSESPSSLVRLVCKDIYHRSCLKSHLLDLSQKGSSAALKEAKCLKCNSLLIDLTKQPKSKLREGVQVFVAQLTSGSLASTSTPQSSSSSLSSRTNAAASSESKERLVDDSFVMVSAPSTTSATPTISPSQSTHHIPSSSTSSASSSFSSSQHARHAHNTDTTGDHQRHPIISPASSSSSSSVSLSIQRDLESQQSDDKYSKPSRTSRFNAIRAAASSNSLQRWCRPQRLILIVMLLAFLASIIFYIKFFLQMNDGGAEAAHAAAAVFVQPPSTSPSAAAIPMQSLRAEIVNAE